MKHRQKSLKLYCFSPPVMIATFLIEIAGAAFVWWRYKTTKSIKIIVGLLTCLAIFQLAEFNVCEGWLGVDGNFWSRVGYGAITMLPPLGIHLGLTIRGRKDLLGKYLPLVAYSSGVMFAGYFLLVAGGVTFNQCLGNYVLFKMSPEIGYLYGTFYFGWLLVGSAICFWDSNHLPKNIQNRLKFLGIGYLSFIVPTTVVVLADRQTFAGVPSIMCGFAVLLAFFLVFKVAPEEPAHEIGLVKKLKELFANES